VVIHPRPWSSELACRRILMLTTFDKDRYLYEAMKVGASRLMLKSAPPSSSSQPSGCRRRRHAARTLHHPSAARGLHPPTSTGQGPSPLLEELTAREVEILRLIANGLSNQGHRRHAPRQRVHRQDPHQPPLPELDIRERAQAVGSVQGGRDVERVEEF
jgi:hypothetical protein